MSCRVSGSVGKILVIRGGAIGDFILTLPALRALRERFSTARIEVLGYPRIVDLAVAGGLVDQAESIEARALAFFFAKGGDLNTDLSRYFSEFDLIISYLYDPDSIFRTNVGRCSRAQFIQGPHRPDEGDSISAGRVYLKPLERLAIFDADEVPRLDLAGVTLEAGSKPDLQKAVHSEGLLALHPGSGSERKNWPEEKWLKLIHLLVTRTGLNFLLVGGEAEASRLRGLEESIPIERRRVAINRPLPELGRQLCLCTGFLGHDSGISHLASAVGLSGIVLWGPTQVKVWRPPSRRFKVLQHPRGLDGLEPGTVFIELCDHLKILDLSN